MAISFCIFVYWPLLRVYELEALVALNNNNDNIYIYIYIYIYIEREREREREREAVKRDRVRKKMHK